MNLFVKRENDRKRREGTFNKNDEGDIMFLLSEITFLIFMIAFC